MDTSDRRIYKVNIDWICSRWATSFPFCHPVQSPLAAREQFAGWGEEAWCHGPIGKSGDLASNAV